MSNTGTLTILACSVDRNDWQWQVDGNSYNVVDNDYVPRNIGLGGGDYVEFTVDIATGQIIGWDAERVQEALKELATREGYIESEI